MPLSEQHPREQGLKPSVLDLANTTFALSEQHPREQGLKLVHNNVDTTAGNIFQSNIQENKD